jgi:hypothetical protein
MAPRQDKIHLKQTCLVLAHNEMNVGLKKKVVLSKWHAELEQMDIDRTHQRWFALFWSIHCILHSFHPMLWIVLFWNNAPFCRWKKEKVELVSVLIGLLVHEKSEFERTSTSPDSLLMTLAKPDHLFVTSAVQESRHQHLCQHLGHHMQFDRSKEPNNDDC